MKELVKDSMNEIIVLDNKHSIESLCKIMDELGWGEKIKCYSLPGEDEETLKRYYEIIK